MAEFVTSVAESVRCLQSPIVYKLDNDDLGLLPASLGVHPIEYNVPAVCVADHDPSAHVELADTIVPTTTSTGEDEQVTAGPEPNVICSVRPLEAVIGMIGIVTVPSSLNTNVDVDIVSVVSVNLDIVTAITDAP